LTECSIPCVGFDGLAELLAKQPKETRLAYTGSIEVTPHCNLKCAHCYVAPCHWEGNLLSYEELCRIIDEVAEAGCIWLLLTGGEPFLRNDFLDIYAHAKKKGMLVSIFTNGTLVTPEIARYLHDWTPHIIEISVYGATEATYESVTGVPGSYKRCLRGIELLIEQGIQVRLKTMLMTLNQHEYWDMKKLAESYGAPFKFDAVMNPRLDGSLNPYELRLSPEEIVRIEEEDPQYREAWIENYRKFSDLEVSQDLVFTCGAGRGRFHIDAFGRLQLCIITRQPSYNLRQGSFKEGWGKFFPAVLDQRLSKPSSCRSCRNRAICHICPGWTQLECGTSEEQPIEYLCQLSRLRAETFGLERTAVDNK